MLTIIRPTEDQVLLFSAVYREMRKRTDKLSDDECALIVARFVNEFDFNNSAIAHKSAGGWAKLLIAEYEQDDQPFDGDTEKTEDNELCQDARRVGTAKGVFNVPSTTEEFDSCNDEIADLFGRETSGSRRFTDEQLKNWYFEAVRCELILHNGLLPDEVDEVLEAYELRERLDEAPMIYQHDAVESTVEDILREGLFEPFKGLF